MNYLKNIFNIKNNPKFCIKCIICPVLDWYRKPNYTFFCPIFTESKGVSGVQRGIDNVAVTLVTFT